MAEATFKDQVYQHILDQILTRTLSPGDLLDRKQIAADLQVSLIPVSDAVQQLTYEGFLTTRRRLGTFVRTPSLEDVRGALILREALECQAAREYCGQPLQQARRKLLPLAKAADQAADAHGRLWTEDFAFHEALVQVTGCAALLDCFQRVVNLSMFYDVALVSPMRPATYDRHTKLLNELCELNADRAAERIRQHIRTGKEPLLGTSM